MLAGKDRVEVPGAERRKILDGGHQFLIDFLKAQFIVDFYLALQFLAVEPFLHFFFERFLEAFEVLQFDGEPGGVFMPAVMLQKMPAGGNGFIDVESLYRTRRAYQGVFAAVGGGGENDGGAVKGFDESRCHDTDNPLVPRFLEHHRGGFSGILQIVADQFKGVFGGLFVEVLAVVVVFVDQFGYLLGRRQVAAQEQAHRVLSVLYPAGGVDARAERENKIVVGDLPVKDTGSCLAASGQGRRHVAVLRRIVGLDVGVVEQREHARARPGVDKHKPEVRQHAVFAQNRHDIGSDAHGRQVEQGIDILAQIHVVLERVCPDQLEPDSTARKVFVGVGAVAPFGIQHRIGAGNLTFGKMMVAHNHIDALFFGIEHFFVGLDAAVEHNHQAHPVFVGVIDTPFGEPVSVQITVGHEKAQNIGVRNDFFQESINQSHCRDAVHIVVAIYADAFFARYGTLQAFHRPVHILHQERIVQLVQIGMEKLIGFLLGRNAPLEQQPGHVRIVVQAVRYVSV